LDNGTFLKRELEISRLQNLEENKITVKMVKVKELKARMGNVEIEVEVVSVSEPREFNKYGREDKGATAKVKDDTGQGDLSLWNDQCDQIKAGDKVKIANGYVSEWQNNLQLTAGKFGTLTVVKGK